MALHDSFVANTDRAGRYRIRTSENPLKPNFLEPRLDKVRMIPVPRTPLERGNSAFEGYIGHVPEIGCPLESVRDKRRRRSCNC